jgi:predicted metal-dependent peptidase
MATKPAPASVVITSVAKAEIITKLRSRILVHSPGMANLLLWVDPVLREGTGPAPAVNDGKSIYLFDNYFNLPLQQQLYYMLHNVLHIALRHATRAQKLRRLNPTDFNYAACVAAQDAIINWSLEGHSWISVPENAMTYGRLLSSDALRATPPEKWSMELLYKELKGSKKAAEVEKDIEIPDDVTEATESATEEESNDSLWEKRMTRAMSLSGSCNLLRKLGADVKVSKTPWHLILKKHLIAALSSKIESNFSRPHRRTSAGVIDFFMPSTQRQRSVKEVAFVVDTSGSITDRDLSRCLREVLSVQSITSSNIRFISADAAVQTDVTLNALQATADSVKNLFKTQVKGGGGTDFRPAIELLAKKPPTICVYLTDTYGAFPVEAPKFPVIWVSLTKDKAPWGVTIEMTNDE